ncbi:hypothetical protein H072_10246 [Dactylellina haptotyla CBS 200.50]|uniref:Uncharacterized protein n=1 Tax=Dactylellina haptotyla (strain CBS 200.50) TaxID=1284197 RepID=S7ZZF8_DACHA|nr:hypothetical protein H072_10246 [Dactylellina haptotyla CBS 200.50]
MCTGHSQQQDPTDAGYAVAPSDTDSNYIHPAEDDNSAPAEPERENSVDNLTDEINSIEVSSPDFLFNESRRSTEAALIQETNLHLLGTNMTNNIFGLAVTPMERFKNTFCRSENPIPWYSCTRHHPYKPPSFLRRKRAASYPSSMASTRKLTLRTRSLSHASTTPTSYVE